MMKLPAFPIAALLFSAALTPACAPASGGLPKIAAPERGHVPGESWELLADPAALGWRTEELEKAHRIWKELPGSSSVVIVQRGAIVEQWGDPNEKRTMRSIRKSLLSGLLAAPVADGRLKLDATLAELGIDDRTPLTAEEKGATLEQLLSARSGVYIPAARENSGHRRRRPERGSHPPGSFFYYNNWDFNVLGVIYRDRVSPDVGGAFAREIAGPIGMEDFEPGDFEWRPEKVSPHPAYDFELTARDLARYGLLWARGGRWGERQVVDASWVERSTRTVTPETYTGAGYGWLWWVMPPGKNEAVPEGYFQAEGTSVMLVIPARDLVVVHQIESDWMLVRLKLGMIPSDEESWEMLSAIVRAAPTP